MDREAILKAVIKSADTLGNLGMTTSLNLGVDFVAQVKIGNLSDDAVAQAAHNLFKAIEMECLGVICFRTDECNTKILEGYPPHSSHLQDRFPRALREIEEASKCILYERGTACVFHVMRAVEVVLKATWKTLGLSPPKLSDSWGALLQPLDQQLQPLLAPSARNPTWQSNLSFFSEVVADVRATKRCYRDTTMHVESTYTLEEARAIFNAVKTLVSDAAKHLDQDGNVY